MNILNYDFMKKALLVGILVSIMIPAIGTVAINKRSSTIGDALSHTSLAGVIIGLILGFNPIVGAIIVCIVSAFGIEFLRGKLPKNSDLPTAIIMSFGIGLSAILSDFISGTANLDSFLFGSISAIDDFELILIIIVFIIVMLSFTIMYKKMLYIIFDEVGAKLSGINVRLINNIFIFIMALAIAVASRIVGVLMISSLMILPVAVSLKICKSYLKTVVLSSTLGLLYTTTGIIISFYFDLKPGGVIVLIGVSILMGVLFLKKEK